MAKAKMIDWHGSPAVEVDGRILPPMAFTAHAHTRDREYLRAGKGRDRDLLSDLRSGMAL